jgi:uncharacterized protein
VTNYSFADVVHESLSFSDLVPSQAIVLTLLDTKWVQRLRDIHQTANTRLVYMFSEHSRFGHSLGVAYLADKVLDRLERMHPERVRPYRNAVTAAALLHDIGHLAPGSHTAFKAWFPTQPDSHEEVAGEIIRNDQELLDILTSADPTLPSQVCSVLNEDESLPPWTWQIISGGGWNVDRGNWCIVDSILAGVRYGQYNIGALTESIDLSDDGRLVLKENRMDAMMHFSVSRHAMYRQIYHHRVLLSADTLNIAIVKRARNIQEDLEFADEWMKNALTAKSPLDLKLDTVFQMRESWWRYHIARWGNGNDEILADLSRRLLCRDLFKTVRVTDQSDEQEVLHMAQSKATKLGYDPEYYVHTVSTTDTHAGESQQPMLVKLDSGQLRPLPQCDPLFEALGRAETRSWIVMPEEVKRAMGRFR